MTFAFGVVSVVSFGILRKIVLFSMTVLKNYKVLRNLNTILYHLTYRLLRIEVDQQLTGTASVFKELRSGDSEIEAFEEEIFVCRRRKVEIAQRHCHIIFVYTFYNFDQKVNFIPSRHNNRGVIFIQKLISKLFDRFLCRLSSSLVSQSIR